MSAEFKEITAVWKDGMQFEASGSKGLPVRLGAGGDDSPASPMEYLLMALAGCTGMDVISILEKKRQPARSLEIRVKGKRAEDHPKVYTEIEIEFILSGESLTPEAVARAIELSETKYCSVGGMLKQAAVIRTSYRILPMESAHE